MWGKIIIPMYMLWLHSLYVLYGPRCPLSPKRPINLISLSLIVIMGPFYMNNGNLYTDNTTSLISKGLRVHLAPICIVTIDKFPPTVSVLLYIFPVQSPVTWSFDVFFDLRLNKRLNKQLWGWWFETPSRSLWHCNEQFFLHPLIYVSVGVRMMFSVLGLMPNLWVKQYRNTFGMDIFHLWFFISHTNFCSRTHFLLKS